MSVMFKTMMNYTMSQKKSNKTNLSFMIVLMMVLETERESNNDYDSDIFGFDVFVLCGLHYW